MKYVYHMQFDAYVYKYYTVDTSDWNYPVDGGLLQISERMRAIIGRHRLAIPVGIRFSVAHLGRPISISSFVVDNKMAQGNSMAHIEALVANEMATLVHVCSGLPSDERRIIIGYATNFRFVAPPKFSQVHYFERNQG